MRKLILERIENIKNQANEFRPTVMKWSNFKIYDTPIFEFDFNTLTDEQLVYIFERIVIKNSKQG